MTARTLFLFAFLFLAVTYTGYVISSSGGKIGRTEVGCTCHGDLNAGNSAISISASPDIFTSGYAAENTYSISIVVSGGPVGGGGGFNLKASAGSFSNPGSNAQIIGGEVTHSNPNARNWTVDWTAPAASVDSVIFNFAGNSVNLNGNTSGDDPTPLGERIAHKAATAVFENPAAGRKDFVLFQNYPNPFNSWTQIRYQIQRSGVVKLKIFTLTGKEIYSKSIYHSAPGKYQLQWRGKTDAGESVASGVYLYKLSFENQVEMKRLVLLK